MENVIQSKSFRFALRVVKLCKFLQDTQKEFIMTKQLLRCGTSIGANVAESEHAQSKADFSSKLNIALKEAAETDYWLRLLHEAEILSDSEFQSIYTDCQEIERLLASIVKTTKK
ncbi:MAG: four helix bundle protein [Oscillospiraceae bacterium]|nr:four helix bundle protein [Oscillospiraceae bacterium]